jgi:hypothetical protein
LKTEHHSVQSKFEQSLRIMAYARSLDSGRARESVGGECLLGAGVLDLAATDIAARRPAGLGERMTDHQAPEAIEPIGGLLVGESGVEQDCRDCFDEFKCGLGNRRARTQQCHRFSVGEQGAAGRSGDGPQVVIPTARARGELDLCVHTFDKSVKQRGFVDDVVIDSHGVDPKLGTQLAHRQPLESVFVGDPQGDAEDPLARDDGGTAPAWGGGRGRMCECWIDSHRQLFYSVDNSTL